MTETMNEPMVELMKGGVEEGAKHTLGKRSREEATETSQYKTESDNLSQPPPPGPCSSPPVLCVGAVVQSGSAGLNGGDGGCTASAMKDIGVWESKEAAVVALNAQIGPMHEELERRWGKKCDVSEAGIEDEQWHEEAIKRAVVAQGWHFKKLKIDATDPKAVGLKEELRDGSYFMIGVTNNAWVRGSKRQKLKYPGYNATAPAVDAAGWVHSVAIMNGRLLDHGANESLASLWLGSKNQPNPHKGYMRSIRKVWRMTKCCNHGTGCRGECVGS